MFRLFFVLVTSFLTLGISPAYSGDSNETEWLTNVDEAREMAETTGRNILMSFSGSDWCIPCMRLQKDLFDTGEFNSFTDQHLILLKLDFPSRKKNLLSEEQVKHNEALAEQYNKKGSFPLVVITDAEGHVKGHMDHPLSSARAYIQSIDSILKSK